MFLHLLYLENPNKCLKKEEELYLEIIAIICCRFLGFRDEEEARLKSDPKLTLGDVTTINLTIMQGGVQVRHMVVSRYGIC